MQSDASHSNPNRDSSVSVATVQKLIAGASFGGPRKACQCPTLPAPRCRTALVWPLFVVVAKEL